MEVTDNSQFSNTDGYTSDIEEDCFDEMNYLDSSLDLNTRLAHTVDDIGLRYLPSTSRIAMISENQSTENFIKEFDSFYSEMMGKVNGLKNVPALKKANYKEIDNYDEEKLFGNLKNTPKVQEQLDEIKKLDDEISSVISDYHSEKSERLEIQKQLCNELTKTSSYPERDTDLFLNLCQFEFSNNKEEKKDTKGESSEKNRKPKSDLPKKPNEFIVRNIVLAKEGVFANSSLTDEEKVKLEDILQYEDTQERPHQRSPFTLPNSLSDVPKYFSNAFAYTAEEKKKIEEIDSELEKFKLDENKSEKNISQKESDESSHTKNIGDLIRSKEEVEKMNHVLLEKKLKKLESRLKEIQEAEKIDMEKLRKIKEKSEKYLDKGETDLNEEELDTLDLGDLLELDELNCEVTEQGENIQDLMKEVREARNSLMEIDDEDEEAELGSLSDNSPRDE